jgi:putative endonuclease
MDQFVVYVLFSPSSGKTYTGMTSALISRFHYHNSKSKKGFTTRFRPWIVVHTEFFESKKSALSREAELKSGNGRSWVRNQILTQYTGSVG